MRCTHPVVINPDPARYPYGLRVPCGKCVQCKIHRREEWTIRLQHELQSWDSALFLTLTYRDHPGTLRKRDVQLWLKRLRKVISPRKVKYYICGEYGDQYGRPHYHAIMYGLGVGDSDVVCDTWYHGMVHVGSVTRDSIRYVAQYIDTVYGGDMADVVYADRVVPWAVMSKGLGRKHALSQRDQYVEYGYLTDRGVKHGLPRYYLSVLGLTDDELARIKDKVVDREVEQMYDYIGVHMSRDEIMAMYPASIVADVLRAEVIEANQCESNVKARMRISADRKRKRKF